MYWLRRAYLTCWAFALAWKPAQRWKNPDSAPLALIVSTMSMPAIVALARFDWSRICTRMMLTRFLEMTRATKMLSTVAATPIAASMGE